MNFSDEEYVRLYVSDTVTWKCLEWQGQALLALALRKFDRAGLLEFGHHGASKALMVATGLPMEVIEVGLAKLLAEEVWVCREACLFWPKYIEAQTCTRSDRVRQRTSRARRAACDITSRNVTGSHETEPGVTDVTECHSRRGEGMARQGKAQEESPERNQPVRPTLNHVERQERSFRTADPAGVELFQAWKEAAGKSGAEYDWKRRELFERLVTEGVTSETVRLVVSGAKFDQWATESQKLAPASILGSAEQREKYIEMARNPPRKNRREPPQPNNLEQPYKLNIV